MTPRAPRVRVAFFTDSYYEANGVARTSNALQAYAAAHDLPMLVVHGGRVTQVTESGSIVRLELGRSDRTSVALEHDLQFDLALWRHYRLIAQLLKEFKPDVLHFTGPSDIGLLGAWFGRRQKIPMVGSWHTNLHEYAARRLSKWLPQHWLLRAVEQVSLRIVVRFYKKPRVVLAPNAEWQTILRRRTGKPTAVMTRGIDTNAFGPERRTTSGDAVNVGYVGRLSTEKNIALLPRLERALIDAGINYQFTIVGEGTDSAWLRAQMTRAQFTGVLRGDALAAAYADMDVFAFPSETETVGNVVLEAMASGVPVVAMSRGGHRFITTAGRSALIAENGEQFIGLTVALANNPALRHSMGRNARADACDRSWNSVFDDVYQSYAEAVALAAPTRTHASVVSVGEEQASATNS